MPCSRACDVIKLASYVLSYIIILLTGTQEIGKCTIMTTNEPKVGII